MIKKIVLALVVLLAIAQVVRPTKNNSGDTQKDISTLYPMPDDVKVIVNKACADCHSNNTSYPFYANIQPIAYWLEDHVKDGKKHLNFDEYTQRSLRYQYHKMEEVNLDKKLTANQLFKEYKDEGGTLNFSDWLTREKTKGIFPINANLNQEVGRKLIDLKQEEMNKTVLGFPVSTLLIAGGVIIVAIVAVNVLKKKA